MLSTAVSLKLPERHLSRLLLADADQPVRAAVAEALVALLALSVHQVESAGAALQAVAAERFDIAILDAALPDGDGRDLCAELRRRGVMVPILMLTGLGREADVVRGLDAGANDYVVKPFRPYELAARVRAQLRQHEISEDAEIRIGDQVFRPSEKTLSQPGQSRPLRLTEKEAAVLKYLHRANGAVVTRTELLRDVWGYNADAATHTVETHVYRLRCKLEPSPDRPHFLLNMRGGYVLLRANSPTWTLAIENRDDQSGFPRMAA